ncbi:MAG: integron integrase [Desulfobacterales bacterium]|nr:integron integrase [Desulfobacterales bacterium]
MEDIKKFKPDPKLKLMDQVRQVLRYYNYSYNTEKIYCGWIVKYIKFFNSLNYSSEMEGKEIEVFLRHLALDKKVSPATQKQALNSLFFLYQKVLDKETSKKIELIKIKKSNNLPVVLAQEEVIKVFSFMKNNHLLMVKLLYGCGLRLMECLRLRIQDINFEINKIYVRSVKGGKDRTIMLPGSIRDNLIAQKEKVRSVHQNDLKMGYGAIGLPEAMSSKPITSVKSFDFQYLFGAKKISKDPRSGEIRRHHVLESGLQKAVKIAAKRAGINKHITCHTFRHSFATHLLENGTDIKTVQKLMGHANVKMTEVYIKAMKKEPPPVISPLDTCLDFPNWKV